MGNQIQSSPQLDNHKKNFFEREIKTLKNILALLLVVVLQKCAEEYKTIQQKNFGKLAETMLLLCSVLWNKLPIKEKQKNNLLHGFISNWNLSKKSQRKKKKKYKTKKFFPSFEINKNYMYLVFEFNQYDSGWKKNDTRELLEITSQIIFHHYIFYCMYNMDLPVIHWWEPYFLNKNL